VVSAKSAQKTENKEDELHASAKERAKNVEVIEEKGDELNARAPLA
jgi:hypothetical protein